ncbi:MAG: hypothetical protein JXA21_06235 [Anaerolineae bacterium]|nr:hypothetical protein [Anaerolineae bacterium]
MNLLLRILGHKSLTASWIADPAMPIQVDLNSGQFCGVALGAPIEALSRLGPSSNTRVRGRDDVLVYLKHGFQLFLDKARRLETVDINVLAAEDMAAFVGQWYHQGQIVTVDAASTLEHIQSFMGAPDDTDDNSILYAHPGYAIWFEWGEEGHLENVTLSTMDTPS